MERREDSVEIRPERRRGDVVAYGTLACPDCDAPVAPHGSVSLVASLACPFCGRSGAVRDFLSLATPTRPAHVVVRLRSRSEGPRLTRR